jgi:hypothetical protein
LHGTSSRHLHPQRPLEGAFPGSVPPGQEVEMANDDAGRPTPAPPDAEGIVLKDLPCSEEELTAAQAEDVAGGAVPMTGAGLCWIAANTQLDSCWIENNGTKTIRPSS